MARTTTSSAGLAQLVKECRRLGIKRLRRGAFEVEFFDVAPRPPSQRVTKKLIDEAAKAFGVENDPQDRCACSHSLSVEHNEHGCLLGCSTELCATTESGSGKV